MQHPLTCTNTLGSEVHLHKKQILFSLSFFYYPKKLGLHSRLNSRAFRRVYVPTGVYFPSFKSLMLETGVNGLPTNTLARWRQYSLNSKRFRWFLEI